MYQNDYKTSLRNSGRVTRKTVYGEKYDYGEKVKEKRNYILFVSGTGREKKEIEQIELPPPQTKILEQRQLIDNYQYHESKNIRKQNPNRLSFTRHKRLSIPFEKTTYTEVTEDGTPIKYNTSYSKNSIVRNVPIVKNLRTESYTNRKYFPRNNTESSIQNYSFQRNIRKFGEKPFTKYYQNRVKTETMQDGEYVVKITKKKKNIDRNQRYVSGNYNSLNNSFSQLRKIGNTSAKNYGFYESKNVKKIGRVNNPTTYQYRREERNITSGFGKSSSYDKNLRNAGKNSFNSRFEKKVKTTKRGYGYNQNKFGGKCEFLGKVECPFHGKKTIRKEYVY